MCVYVQCQCKILYLIQYISVYNETYYQSHSFSQHVSVVYEGADKSLVL
jgi:hypothetical protein